MEQNPEVEIAQTAQETTGQPTADMSATQVENIAKILDSQPGLKEKLFGMYQPQPETTPTTPEATTPEATPTPAPPGTPPTYDTTVDFRAISNRDFIAHQSKSGNHEGDLRAQLHNRYPDLSGQNVDEIIQISKSQIDHRFQLTGIHPMDYNRELRTNALSIVEECKVRASQAEQRKISLESEHQRICDYEFGQKYSRERQREVEAYFAEQLFMPIEEIRAFPAERYAKLVDSYAKKSWDPGAISSNDEKNRVEERRKSYKDIFATLR